MTPHERWNVQIIEARGPRTTVHYFVGILAYERSDAIERALRKHDDQRPPCQTIRRVSAQRTPPTP